MPLSFSLFESAVSQLSPRDREVYDRAVETLIREGASQEEADVQIRALISGFYADVTEDEDED